MKYFKKIINWVCKQYDIFFDKKPKKRVYTIKGKKYILKGKKCQESLEKDRTLQAE
jgi:hypothetical protein